MSDTPKERVGRGHPPLNTRIQPGSTLNPKGRPRGALGIKTIVRKIARERHTVRVGIKTKRISTRDLLIDILIELTTRGNLRAVRLRDNLRPAEKNGEGTRSILLISERPSEDVWEHEAHIVLSGDTDERGGSRLTGQPSPWKVLKEKYGPRTSR